MPAIPITINYASVFQIQNTADIIATVVGTPQRDDILVSTESIAQYFLYSRILGSANNFGQNSQAHLNYPGGFITVQDKINSKWSDFTVTNTLTIGQSSFFNEGINMLNANNQITNRVTNVRRVPSLNRFNDSSLDNDALTVSDFKAYHFVPGMIMAWSGTYQNLVTNLPMWRLCAPPDIPQNTNFIILNTPTGDISIPNLQGRFIMAGRYSQHGSYQAVDQNGFITGVSAQRTSIDGGVDGVIQTTNIGGANIITINQTQMPQHKHDNAITLAGSTTTVSQTEDFIEATASATLSEYYSHSTGGWNTTIDGRSDHNTRRFDITDGVRRLALTLDTIQIQNTPLVINKRQTSLNGTTTIVAPTITRNNSTYVYQGVINPSPNLENRGNGESHENRPPFYALAYIVYTGVSR